MIFIPVDNLWNPKILSDYAAIVDNDENDNTQRSMSIESRLPLSPMQNSYDMKKLLKC